MYTYSIIFLQKLQERQSVFSKRSYQENDRAKWKKVLQLEMISSEESSDEKIIVKPLPWRSDKVNQFFQALDEQLHMEKSDQSKRQKKERIVGTLSTRKTPHANVDIPSWAFKKN